VCATVTNATVTYATVVCDTVVCDTVVCDTVVPAIDATATAIAATFVGTFTCVSPLLASLLDDTVARSGAEEGQRHQHGQNGNGSHGQLASEVQQFVRVWDSGHG
jgi:hypothetical protein